MTIKVIWFDLILNNIIRLLKKCIIQTRNWLLYLLIEMFIELLNIFNGENVVWCCLTNCIFNIKYFHFEFLPHAEFLNVACFDFSWRFSVNLASAAQPYAVNRCFIYSSYIHCSPITLNIIQIWIILAFWCLHSYRCLNHVTCLALMSSPEVYVPELSPGRPRPNLYPGCATSQGEAAC